MCERSELHVIDSERSGNYYVTLSKFYGPVCVFQELLPASVSVVAEVDVDKGTMAWFDGLLDELHARLFRCPTTFPDVTSCACADDVFPDSTASHASRNHVIE